MAELPLAMGGAGWISGDCFGSSVVERELYLCFVCSAHQGLQTGVSAPFPSHGTRITDPELFSGH